MQFMIILNTAIERHVVCLYVYIHIQAHILMFLWSDGCRNLRERIIKGLEDG
jgi:hypothetical protein